MFHVPWRERQAHSAAAVTLLLQGRGGTKNSRRVARLSRIHGARYDHAASNIRLLLADAPAGGRAWVRYRDCSHSLSREAGRRRRDQNPRHETLGSTMSEGSRTRFVVMAYIAFAGASYAQQMEVADEARIDAGMHAAFHKASPDWLARLKGD